MIRSSADSATEVVAKLRLSPQEQAQILNELDASSAAFARKNSGRVAERHPLPPAFCVKLRVQHPGGTARSFWVRARNISDTGIGLLYGGFLHASSQCQVEIFDAGNPLISIPARVVRCRYVRNSIHEVGLLFARPIESELILRSERIDEDASDETPVAPPPPRLAGRVLYVDPVDADRRYVSYRLSQMHLTFRTAVNAQDALQLATAEKFDLILSELRLEPDPAHYLIRRLRSGGNRTPLIILSPSISKNAAQELTDIGATACLNKPFSPETFAKLLAQHLPPRGAAVPASKKPGLLSTHWADPALRPLIMDFVVELTETVESLSTEMIQSANPAELTRRSHQLSATAGLYGFPKLSEACSELVTLLTIDPFPTDLIMEHMLQLDALALDANRAIQ